MKALVQPTPDEVHALRRAQRMTAQEFGDIVFVTSASVYGWEKGRRVCPVNTWELLLIYFGKRKPRTYRN